MANSEASLPPPFSGALHAHPSLGPFPAPTQEHKKDYSSRRGLEKILSKRKSLLKYLFDTDRAAYNKVVSECGIRDKLTSQVGVVARPGSALA